MPIVSSVQELAEIRAALLIGNRGLRSEATSAAIQVLSDLLDTQGGHYLLLNDPHDRANFTGCSTARGASDEMAGDHTTYTVYDQPVGAICPNCGETITAPEAPEGS